MTDESGDVPSPFEQFIDENVKKIRIKTGEFVARFSREDVQRGLKEPGTHKFFRLEMPYEEAFNKLQQIKDKLDATPISESIKINNLNLETDLYNFHQLYNIIFMTSVDPTREISLEEAQGFPEERTYMASLYNSFVGFIYLTVEDDPLGESGIVEKVGAVAGVGVLAKHRGKKIGLKLLKTAIEYFEDKGISKLICEVYEKNEASLYMFTSLGMTVAGIMILEEEQPIE